MGTQHFDCCFFPFLFISLFFSLSFPLFFIFYFQKNDAVERKE